MLVSKPAVIVALYHDCVRGKGDSRKNSVHWVDKVTYIETDRPK